MRGIHEPNEWLKHTDVKASPAVEVTNEEVASALTFKGRLKRGWRHIANAFNVATGATGRPRRDSITSTHLSHSDVDPTSDETNPYAPTSAINQINKDLNLHNQNHNQPRRFSFLAVNPPPPLSTSTSTSTTKQVLPEDHSNVPIIVAPTPKVARTSSVSSSSSNRRKSGHYLSSSQHITSPRSSISNELGNSPPTTQHNNTDSNSRQGSPAPPPMIRGNSDTCTLNNAENDIDSVTTGSRSSAASPSFAKRGSIRTFLKGLTLGNRKSSMSSTNSRLNSSDSPDHKSTNSDMRKISASSLSPSYLQVNKSANLSGPPPISLTNQQVNLPNHVINSMTMSSIQMNNNGDNDDDVDIDVQLSGNSDSSDDESDNESYQQNNINRSSMFIINDDVDKNLDNEHDEGSDEEIEDHNDDDLSDDPADLIDQPSTYWTNRGDGWRQINNPMTSEATSVATALSEQGTSPKDNTSTPATLGSNNNESLTDTASLATFKLPSNHEQSQQSQQSHQQQPISQIIEESSRKSKSSSSSSSEEENDTLEIAPRRSRASSFALGNKSPSMSLSPSKANVSSSILGPPPPSSFQASQPQSTTTPSHNH